MAKMQSLDNKFRLSRLNIFLVDFRQALRFAAHILDAKVHDVKGEHAKSKLVHLAINTSLVISYSRPFTGTRESEQSRPTILIKQGLVDTVFGEETERELHTKILDKRNRAIAHSDAVAHEIAGFNYDGRTIQLYKTAFDPLSQDEIVTVKKMIRQWINHFEAERSKLREPLGLSPKT